MPVIYTIDKAPAYILVHMAAALAAVMIGGVVLFRHKGTASHRIMGRIWVTLMFTVALGSFLIQVRGHFSVIHLLSTAIIVNLVIAIYAARNNNVRRHKWNMRIAYASLCIAGLFTLLPYRMLGQLVFSQ